MSRLSQFLWGFFIALFFGGALVWLLLPAIMEVTGRVKPAAKNEMNSAKNIDLKPAKNEEKVEIIPDTSKSLVRVSNYSDLGVDYEIDTEAGRRVRRVFSGKRINIAVIGVDSRLGSRYKHADANHIMSILIDQGKIEITAIPRDTPSDVGLELDSNATDSIGQNKLAVLRAVRGRNAYLKEAAAIAELDRIHYYIEFGFSQAMGILEWLGYEDAGSALQVLRSRHTIAGDDYQRCYNQSQFMRQVILKYFDKFDGLMGEVFVRGGLALVETNLTAAKAKSIISKLRNNGFGDPDDVFVRVRPPIALRFRNFDFTDKNTFNKLLKMVENKDKADDSAFVNLVYNRLNAELSRAAKDSVKFPKQVINRLRTYFDQKAWLQISDLKKREEIRAGFEKMLSDAHIKRGELEKAVEIHENIAAEKKLFANPAYLISLRKNEIESDTSIKKLSKKVIRK